MVDTGSGYKTINEEALRTLRDSGGATFVKKLSGILANGATMTVSVYRIDEIRIGTSCTLRDIEVVPLPDGNI